MLLHGDRLLLLVTDFNLASQTEDAVVRARAGLLGADTAFRETANRKTNFITVALAQDIQRKNANGTIKRVLFFLTVQLHSAGARCGRNAEHCTH